jgi:hypothetical protein
MAPNRLKKFGLFNPTLFVDGSLTITTLHRAPSAGVDELDPCQDTSQPQDCLHPKRAKADHLLIRFAVSTARLTSITSPTFDKVTKIVRHGFQARQVSVFLLTLQGLIGSGASDAQR